MSRDEPALPVVIQINGELWHSETPRHGGDAATYNMQAVQIVEKLNFPTHNST